MTRRQRVAVGLAAILAGMAALAGCDATSTVPPTAAPPATTGATTGTAASTAAAGTTTTTVTSTAPHTDLPTPPTAGTAPATTGDVRVRRPAGFPNGGEAFVLARLDPAIRPYCTREPAGSRASDAVAGVYCATRERWGVDAYYDLFPNRADLEASYGRYRRANGVPLDSGDCVPGPGIRASSIPAEGRWGYADSGRRTAGRVMCFKAGGRVWLVTSHTSTRILSFFAADRRRPLTDFWYGAGFPALRPR